MATNIAGLFGNTSKSPMDYQNEMLQGMLVSPGQMGSQGLLQQVVSQMGNAGAQIGAGVGGLLGGKTSAQVRDSSINDALQRVSQGGYATEFEKMKALSEEFGRMGMGAESQQALDRASSLQMNELNIQKAQKDLKQPEYKDFTSIRMVMNASTGQVEPKEFKETRRLQSDGSYRAEDGGAETTGNPEGPALTGPQQERVDRNARTTGGGGGGGGGAQSFPVPQQQATPGQPIPQQGVGRAQLNQPQQLEQQYYDQQADMQRRQKAADTEAEVDRLQREMPIPPFKSIAAKEAAMARAVQAGDATLARRINQTPPFSN